MGMAGVLDSARLRYFIAELTGASPVDVDAMTLGSHGDAMIALPRHATVDGKPLPELVDEATLEQLFQRTRDGGAEIVGAAEDGVGVLRAERVGRGHGRGDREGHPRRRCRCARGRPASTGSRTSTWGCRRSSAAGRRGDRGARPERRRARRAARGRRGHPREVRGPREALEASPPAPRWPLVVAAADDPGQGQDRRPPGRARRRAASPRAGPRLGTSTSSSSRPRAARATPFGATIGEDVVDHGRREPSVAVTIAARTRRPITMNDSDDDHHTGRPRRASAPCPPGRGQDRDARDQAQRARPPDRPAGPHRVRSARASRSGSRPGTLDPHEQRSEPGEQSRPAPRARSPTAARSRARRRASTQSPSVHAVHTSCCPGT